ncbi:MAG: aldo/keto reductase [Chloroflexi bacterium]|nr:aldo/keto reductase [Chloroflexota bacterium]
MGGLMVGEDYRTAIPVVERALEAGINYFDTAQVYGDGRSETNLGRVLNVLKPDVVVGTKAQLSAVDMDRIEEAVIAAAEISLRRLRIDQIPLFQLHNAIGISRQPERQQIGIDDLATVIQAFQKLQKAGKIHAWGINGLGDTTALHQAAAESGTFTLQVCYSLLNPSAGRPVPSDFPYQDYRQLISQAVLAQVGVIAFRIMAGGALTGNSARHPGAAASVTPIASGDDYYADVAQSQSFDYLVTEGCVDSMAEAAIRFAISHPGVSTALVGLSSMDQLEQMIAAEQKGPLPLKTIDRLS